MVVTDLPDFRAIRAEPISTRGLTSDMIWEAVKAGHQIGRMRTTESYTPSEVGIHIATATRASLTEQVLAIGWRQQDVDGQRRLISSDGRIHLVVMLADAGTGVKGLKPRPNRKGAATRAGIHANVSLLGFNEELFESEALPRITSAFEFWVLAVFHFYDKATETYRVRYELSRPTDITAGGIISNWANQVRFPEAAFDEIALSSRDFTRVFSEDEQTSEIDIPVEPRSR